jgi:hypothetical protein
LEEMKKPQDEKFELWELTLSISGNGKDIGEGAKARWTPTGLDLPETTTLENVKEILRAFKAWDTAGAVALADLFTFVRRNGWEREVEVFLAQMEFDLSLVKRAQAVGDVPRALRNPRLNAEHYFVVASLEASEQKRWLDQAVKHKMSGLVLKRSIEAGKVLTKEQIEMMSGQGSGILNYHGVLNRWERWEKKVGGEEGILSWPADALERWVEDVAPIAQLHDKAVAKLKEVAK